MKRALGLAVLLVAAGCASPQPSVVEPTATVTSASPAAVDAPTPTSTERPHAPVQTPLPYALTCAQGITPGDCLRRASEIIDTGTTPRGSKQVVSLLISVDSWTITYNDGTAMTSIQ
jgi:hypothetical protein